MPRASAEGRAAAAYKAGGKPPAPPAGMSAEAAIIWRAIAGSKPIGWFDAGSLPLLQSYCENSAQCRKIEIELRELDIDDPLAGKLEKRLVSLNSACTTTATKLRLTVQNLVERHSRMITEAGPGDVEENEDQLLGGKAVWGGKLTVVS